MIFRVVEDSAEVHPEAAAEDSAGRKMTEETKGSVAGEDLEVAAG